jgi:hypothetical protein
MDKKGEMSGGAIGTLMLLFIAIVVILALVPAIFSNQTALTTKQNAINETYNLNVTGCINATAGGEINGTGTDLDCNITVGGAPTGWKLSDSQCALAGVTVHNSTGGAAGTFTLNTDYYLFAQTGIVEMINGSIYTRNGRANITKIDYTFCPEGYIPESGSRVLAGTIGLFAVLALLVVIAGIVMKKWNENK